VVLLRVTASLYRIAMDEWIDRWMDVYIMGWLRLVGSIKLYVSFAECSLFYRALLRNIHINFSILLTEATPYVKTHAYRVSKRTSGGGRGLLSGFVFGKK